MCPVAGESLNRPDESKLSSVRFLLSPLGWRSQTIGEIFKGTDGACADPGTRIFPATGHKTAVPPSSLIQLTFTSHTGSLFLSLYAPRYCLTASAGFGRQFAKLRALSRLRRRYDSRKYRPPVPPFSPAYALCCFSMPSLSAISAMNSPLVGLSSGMATRQPNARFSDSTRPRLQATSMAWRMARSTLLGLVA